MGPSSILFLLRKFGILCGRHRPRRGRPRRGGFPARSRRQRLAALPRCARTTMCSRRIVRANTRRIRKARSQPSAASRQWQSRPRARHRNPPPHPPSRRLRRPLRWTSPVALLHPVRGPISVGRIATAVTRDRRFARRGRAKGFARLWKQPVGVGYASFVVADGRAFTIEQRRNQEVVAAYDVQTGRELWTNGWNGELRGIDGRRRSARDADVSRGACLRARRRRASCACSTPRTGTLIWRRNILSDNGAGNLSWGMSASPLIVDDKVIVLPGGTRGSSVVAYDKATGDAVWKALNDERRTRRRCW